MSTSLTGTFDTTVSLTGTFDTTVSLTGTVDVYVAGVPPIGSPIGWLLILTHAE